MCKCVDQSWNLAKSVAVNQIASVKLPSALGNINTAPDLSRLPTQSVGLPWQKLNKGFPAGR